MKKNYKRIALILFISLLFPLGCGKPDTATLQTELSTGQMAAAVIDGQEGIPKMEAIDLGNGDFADYLDSYYGIDEALLDGGTVAYAGGVEASEIAVLHFLQPGDAADSEQIFLDYIASRTNDFVGYAPKQAAMVEKGKVVVRGQYVALLICPEPESAEKSFAECFAPGGIPTDVQASSAPMHEPEDTPAQPTQPDAAPTPSVTAPTPSETAPPPTAYTTPDAAQNTPAQATPTDTAENPQTPEPTPDPQEYDKDMVLAAWRTGDTSKLEGKNLNVYKAAVGAIGAVITNDMKDYEKETAIHDYIIETCSFDWDSFDHAPGITPSPDSETPYGMLIHGKGFCTGYTSTFQLFMDLLNIECITVNGASGDLEHAWNMVRLEGEWYCVDVTWDDPSDEPSSHKYLNVSSKYMRATGHQWDGDDVPEATDDTHAYRD